MSAKHIIHIALGVFALFGGVQIGQAVYAKYLKPKAA
jgi:hypothetical protein